MSMVTAGSQPNVVKAGSTARGHPNGQSGAWSPEPPSSMCKIRLTLDLDTRRVHEAWGLTGTTVVSAVADIDSLQGSK